MASRLLNEGPVMLEREVKELYALLTIGGSGAVTLTRGKGIASAVHTNTGRYTLTFTDSYVRLLYADAALMRATATTLPQCKLNAEAVAASKTLEIGVIRTDTGAAADPASGDKIFVRIKLGNA